MPFPSPRLGDIFLLFHAFPFDFDRSLPINAGPGVCLDSTPQHLLDNANPRGLADYVLPGYTFDGGLVHCCLRKPVSIVLPENMTVSQALFLSVTGFRLVAPYGIGIGGQFELEGGPGLIGNPTLYLLESAWQPSMIGGNGRYEALHVNLVNRIGHRIVELSTRSRIMSAYILFSQITTGMTTSLQLATMGLFSALEALFVPQGTKAQTLSDRVGRFLSPIPFPVTITEWLREEYIHRRGRLAHGVQNLLEWRWTEVSQEKIVALGRLHEIVRLSILGFLCMSDLVLAKHSALKGTHLQQFFEGLEPAHGSFLEGQQAYCV